MSGLRTRKSWKCVVWTATSSCVDFAGHETLGMKFRVQPAVVFLSGDIREQQCLLSPGIQS